MRRLAAYGNSGVVLVASAMFLMACASADAATIGTYSGGDVGEGLDLDGTFVYALATGNPSADGNKTIRDATFVPWGANAGVTGVTGVTLVTPASVASLSDYSSADLSTPKPEFGDTANDDNLEDVIDYRLYNLSGGLYDLQIGLDVTAGSPYQLQLLLRYHNAGADNSFAVSLDGVEIHTGWVTAPGESSVLTHEFTPTTSHQANVHMGWDGSAGASAYAFFNAVTLEILDSSAIPGDLDGDGFVGGADLDIVRSFWGQNVTLGNKLHGDPSGDGFVGGADLDLVRAHWGEGTPPAPDAVPEPSTLIGLFGLFGLIFVGSVCRSRRRSRRAC